MMEDVPFERAGVQEEEREEVPGGTGLVPILRERWGGATAGELEHSERSAYEAMRLWQVSVQTPEGERGYVDIPRPAADLALPTGPVCKNSIILLASLYLNSLLLKPLPLIAVFPGHRALLL